MSLHFRGLCVHYCSLTSSEHRTYKPEWKPQTKVRHGTGVFQIPVKEKPALTGMLHKGAILDTIHSMCIVVIQGTYTLA